MAATSFTVDTAMTDCSLRVAGQGAEPGDKCREHVQQQQHGQSFVAASETITERAAETVAL